MSQTNFLIGRGELLTKDIKGPKRRPNKAQAYTVPEAKKRLNPQAKAAAEAIANLADDACPRDFAVARLTMNPSFIAKMHFPTDLLRAVGLESVGSRTVRITPEKWTRKEAPRECSTTELFVAGKREVFRELSYWMDEVDPFSDEAEDLTHIELISSFLPSDRIKSTSTSKDEYFEVGLHLLSDQDSTFIQTEFMRFAKRIGIKVHHELTFTAGTLWFVPVQGKKSSMKALAEFTFVRVIRPVPKLRVMRPVTRATTVTIGCTLPSEQPLSPDLRVAILDGGLPTKHPLDPWLRSYRVFDNDAQDHSDGVEHGLAVTSAFLFGPIQPNGVAQRPYAYADHLRILDHESDKEHPLELYRTLGFIEEVLLSRQYNFINLSLGPDMPIEDTEVHAWTSVIDDLLSDGNTLMTVAVGNNGERDKELRFDRVQVPSDCVNALAVGAASDTSDSWKRAPYSAIGPGRSPGIVKPDLMAFGGDASSYFHALTAELHDHGHQIAFDLRG